MSIMSILEGNPWLWVLAVPVAALIALGAYKMVREFLPW